MATATRKAGTVKAGTVKAAQAKPELKSKFVEKAQHTTETQQDVRGGYAVTYDEELKGFHVFIPVDAKDAPLLAANKETSTGKQYVAKNHRGNVELGIDPEKHKAHILRANGKQYELGLWLVIDPNYTAPAKTNTADDTRVKELEAKLAAQAEEMAKQQAAMMQQMAQMTAMMQQMLSQQAAPAPQTEATEAITAD